MNRRLRILRLLSVKRVVRLMRGFLLSRFMQTPGAWLSIGRRVEFKRLRTLCLGRFVTIGDDVVLGSNIIIGERTGIGRATFVDDGVRIGARVSISRYVSIMTSTHDHRSGQRRAGPVLTLGTLEIGNGSWIGTHAIVLPQVRKIGAYSIVAAGAVVTRDVPDNCIVGGNPARIMKELEPL